MMTELILLGLGILVGVIGYLLAKRDDKRQEEIKTNASAIHELFRLRNQDVMALSEYKLKVAENHYTSTELDSRFAQLNTTMEKGFGSLGEDIKAMTRAMTDHINTHH